MNQPDSDYLPTATIETLQHRSQLLRAIRTFFESRGYWEVETPILSRDTVVDAYIDPFVTTWCATEGTAAEGEPRYLQTSPEFAMKRLLTAGADQIYQITHAFRQAERGAMHNPEFAMLEWYRLGETHHDQMTFVEALVRQVYERATAFCDTSSRPALPETPFERFSYEAAFLQFAGLSALHSTAEQFEQLARDRHLPVPANFDVNDCQAWQNLLLVELIEPALCEKRAIFIYDYPARQAALARIRQGKDLGPEGVAERFELYLHGVEICNGYHELTDADELRTRIRQQSVIRKQEQRPVLPAESYLLQAMEAGLPACAGTALGLDRLIMLALGKQTLQQVIAFPLERA